MNQIQTLAATDTFFTRLTPRMAWLAPLVLVTATLLAYWPAYQGVFVLDDVPYIKDLTSRYSLWPLQDYLGRRGVVNYSLVLNHALDGMNPRGYHVLNMAIHLLAGLTLYGVVRRVLLLPRWNAHFTRVGVWLALVIALLWMVHPLQTQSVTYVIQRTESMAGLFVLLAAYALVRHNEQSRWYWALGCLLSMGLAVLTKESVLPAPIVFLLMDRCLLTGSWKATIRRRWWLHVALLATMAMPLVGGVGEFRPPSVPGMDQARQAARDAGQSEPLHVLPSMMQLGWFPSAGFGLAGMTWQQYFFSQPAVILFYLKQTFWPSWLSIEHNWQVMRTPWAGWRALDLQVALGVLLSLAVGTFWALWRLPWLGFLGCWFFCFLGVSSSFIPINDIAVEHRMYLAQIAVIATIVLLGWWLVGRWAQLQPGHPLPRRLAWGLTVLVVGVTLALGIRTCLRNLDYQSGVKLWSKAVQGHSPSSRLYLNLGSS